MLAPMVPHPTVLGSVLLSARPEPVPLAVPAWWSRAA